MTFDSITTVAGNGNGLRHVILRFQDMPPGGLNLMFLIVSLKACNGKDNILLLFKLDR